MASVQSTIRFPSRKKLSCRSFKRKDEKENADSPKKVISTQKNDSPSKRLAPFDSTLHENGASPPKVRRSILLEHEVNENNAAESGTAKDSTLHENGASPPKVRRSILLEHEVNENNAAESGTAKETEGLTKAIRVLHSCQPTTLYGREDKVDSISSVLLEAANKKESTTLYISGPPGTGKTACINFILALPEIKSNYKTVYLNCTGLKSANAAFTRIAEELGIRKESSGKKILLSIEKYLKTNKRMIMLVLDEMDQLESKRQSLLYTIFEWPSLFKSNLVLLGIANALDLTDRVLPRLQAKLDVVPQLFHFPSYSKDEIISILTSRLREAGVDQVLNGGALQLLAGKVAAVSGDIRKALDIGRRVVEIAHSKSEKEKQVSLHDVLSVVNSVYGTSSVLCYSEKGESFPLHQKILICTMILIKKNSKIKEISLGKLHDVYKKVCAKRNLPSLDMSEFISVTDLVESRGAIRTIGKTKSRLSKIVLLWDESEICNILQDKQFIASIMDDISCLK